MWPYADNLNTSRIAVPDARKTFPSLVTTRNVPELFSIPDPSRAMTRLAEPALKFDFAGSIFQAPASDVPCAKADCEIRPSAVAAMQASKLLLVERMFVGRVIGLSMAEVSGWGFHPLA